jgi:hypothetical protein
MSGARSCTTGPEADLTSRHAELRKRIPSSSQKALTRLPVAWSSGDEHHIWSGSVALEVSSGPVARFGVAAQRSSCDPLRSRIGRIIVRGPEFVGARLTPEAYSLGLAIALPERVQPAPEWVLARPTGVKRADARNIRIPIEAASGGLTAREGA